MLRVWHQWTLVLKFSKEGSTWRQGLDPLEHKCHDKWYAAKRLHQMSMMSASKDSFNILTRLRIWKVLKPVSVYSKINLGKKNRFFYSKLVQIIINYYWARLSKILWFASGEQISNHSDKNRSAFSHTRAWFQVRISKILFAAKHFFEGSYLRAGSRGGLQGQWKGRKKLIEW